MPLTEETFVFNGFPIDKVTVSQASGHIIQMVHTGERGYIVTPNAAHFLYLRKNPELRELYRKASLVLPDGFSIILASRILGNPIRERCTGVDLFDSLCEKFREGQYRIFLLGGINGSEQRAKEMIIRLNRELSVDAYSPPVGFESDSAESGKITGLINEFKPDLLLIFLGSPKSEKFISRNFENLKTITALSLGAALDYFTGEKKMAPEWFRRHGLEWFFRLVKEPARLWKRYLIGNSYFIYLLLRQFFRHRPSQV